MPGLLDGTIFGCRGTAFAAGAVAARLVLGAQREMT
jgi:hypothetical protein